MHELIAWHVNPVKMGHASRGGGGGGGGVMTSHHKSNTRHMYVALAEGGEALVSDQRGEYHTWIQLTTITTLGTSHHTLYLAPFLLFYIFFFLYLLLNAFLVFFCRGARVGLLTTF